jgi:hypothetical protein
MRAVNAERLLASLIAGGIVLGLATSCGGHEGEQAGLMTDPEVKHVEFAIRQQAEHLESATCQRDPQAAAFEVCVIDERGRPLAGVSVYGEFTRYSGSGPYTESAGSAITDATGLAKIVRPPGPTEPRPMWAIAKREGWPPQAEIAPGTIVLGPPRALHGELHFAKPCANREVRVGVHARWEAGSGDPRPEYVHLDLRDVHSFTFENLGPGIYHVSASVCDGEDLQEWSGEVRGSDFGRTLEVPLALWHPISTTR